ncbi:MAG: hypothetical protein H6581_00470 [Bacteroidia bacterium]|nr:hypothetical protein [Bacteroidia bacterium]
MKFLKDFHADLTEKDLQNMIADLENVVKKLPFRVQLSPGERREVANVGEARLPFIIKAEDYTRLFPSAVAPFMRMDETRDNFNSFMRMASLQRRVDRLMEIVSDTSMVASSQVFYIFCRFYENLQAAAETGEEGADLAVADLAKLFKKATGGKSIEEYSAELKKLSEMPLVNADGNLNGEPEG